MKNNGPPNRPVSKYNKRMWIIRLDHVNRFVFETPEDSFETPSHPLFSSSTTSQPPRPHRLHDHHNYATFELSLKSLDRQISTVDHLIWFNSVDFATFLTRSVTSSPRSRIGMDFHGCRRVRWRHASWVFMEQATIPLPDSSSLLSLHMGFLACVWVFRHASGFSGLSIWFVLLATQNSFRICLVWQISEAQHKSCPKSSSRLLFYDGVISLNSQLIVRFPIAR